MIDEATKIPQKAFEAYVKGVQLPERDSKRSNYLKNALHYYGEANGGAVYPQAAFELGRFYMLEGKWKDATEYFNKLQKKDPNYAEAAFYAVLVTRRWVNLVMRSRRWFPCHGCPADWYL